MRSVLSALAGVLTGIAVFFVVVFNNPFSVTPSVSPLAVTDQSLMHLQFSAVPEEALLFTNSGESISEPFPADVLQLWEAPIRNTRVLVTELGNGRGEIVGIGVKFSSDSEASRVLSSKVLADSMWHVYLPGQGTLFVEQRENYWSYLRDIVVKAKLNSADNWRGSWTRVMTAGPNALGTARTFGGHGQFSGLDSEAVESLNASAYSARRGPVAIDGSLIVALPDTLARRAARPVQE